jgi:RNA polymerase sigma-70 factor (ECF subfamily)
MGDVKSFGAFGLSRRDTSVAQPQTPHERVAALYEADREKIYKFLVGQGVDPAKSQELVQEVFFRLFQALRKGIEVESEQAWLYRVASNLAVDYWRREGRSMWVELDSLPAVADRLASRDLTPEAAAVKAQKLRRVSTTLARLPKEQRLGVHLRMQGLRYRDIAKILGVSVPTVSGLLSTAVERLRRAANE